MPPWAKHLATVARKTAAFNCMKREQVEICATACDTINEIDTDIHPDASSMKTFDMIAHISIEDAAMCNPLSTTGTVVQC